MRHESTVTSLSWIPSEAIEGSTRLAFDAGFTHYDDPPPAEIADLRELQAQDRFRFANQLSAWIEVDGTGAITGSGYSGGGLMGSTTVRLGALSRTFQAAQLPDLQRPPEHGDGWVRFSQTTGGRTGLPAPRRVKHPPYVQWQAPLVWTTLTLTLHADGTAETSMTGASTFPRHWVYDAAGQAVAQVRADRLPRLVRPVLRPPHAVGRPGFPGAGHRGGNGAGADPVGAADARQREAEDREAPRRARAGPPGRPGQ